MTINHVLNCPCYAVNECEAREFLKQALKQGCVGYTVAINAEKITRYDSDEKLRMVIDQSIFPYPDGAGAVLGLKTLCDSRSEKINMPQLAIETCCELEASLFIVGARPEVHEVAIEVIKKKYPRLNLVGSIDGYQSEHILIDALRRCKPQMVLIAMGTPRQEILANKLEEIGIHSLFIGCGGALDIFAGKLKRAPAFFINNGLEWLYRLIQEPWRWKRQIKLVKFIFLVLKVKLSVKKH